MNNKDKKINWMNFKIDLMNLVEHCKLNKFLIW